MLLLKRRPQEIIHLYFPGDPRPARIVLTGLTEKSATIGIEADRSIRIVRAEIDGPSGDGPGPSPPAPLTPIGHGPPPTPETELCVRF